MRERSAEQRVFQQRIESDLIAAQRKQEQVRKKRRRKKEKEARRKKEEDEEEEQGKKQEEGSFCFCSFLTSLHFSLLLFLRSLLIGASAFPYLSSGIHCGGSCTENRFAFQTTPTTNQGRNENLCSRKLFSATKYRTESTGSKIAQEILYKCHGDSSL